MTDQRQWRASPPEHWLDELDLILEANDPVRRPLRAIAGVIRIDSEDAEPRCKKIHQSAPLPRGARVRMHAHDSGAGSGLAKEGVDDLPARRRAGGLQILGQGVRVHGHPSSHRAPAILAGAGCASRTRGTSIGTLCRYSAYFSP